jgi:hypothetical protein
MDPCSHMESIWNGQNILRKYLKKDILGEPFVYQPYLTCIMHNSHGKLPVSIWLHNFGEINLCPHMIFFLKLSKNR